MPAMGFFARAGLGAAVGAYEGSKTGNTFSGAFGGAMFGGFGMSAARGFLGRMNPAYKAIAGKAGLTSANKWLANASFGSAIGISRNLNQWGIGKHLAGAGRTSLGGARAAAANKYGGMALAALGATSAANIGTSMIGSNSGYY